ncbi:MAG TPA: YbaK/EbsC family protein [Spirochaetota bacterium]
MLSQKMLDYLRRNKIDYEIVDHPKSFSAQRTAQVSHFPGRMVAKPVILQVDGSLKMIVMPADENIDIMHLMEIFNTRNIHLAREKDFSDIFPECEIGGMPPMGNLYGMDVYVAQDLAKDDTIVFNGGDHRELIKMAYKDYERLVNPRIFS